MQQLFSLRAIQVFVDIYDKALVEMGLPALTPDQRGALAGLFNLLAQGGSNGENPLRDVLAIIESRAPEVERQARLRQLLMPGDLLH